MSSSELLASETPMSLAVDGDGQPCDFSCPCGLIHGEGFEVDFHCWRSSCDAGCQFSGIHVSGEISPADKLKIARHIRANNGWHDSTDWALVIDGIIAETIYAECDPLGDALREVALNPGAFIWETE